MDGENRRSKDASWDLERDEWVPSFPLLPLCAPGLVPYSQTTTRTMSAFLTTSRAATRAVGAAPSAARAFSSTPAPQATLRELEQRIKSVGNIGTLAPCPQRAMPPRTLPHIVGRRR